jgi:hypothetical protein
MSTERKIWYAEGRIITQKTALVSLSRDPEVIATFAESGVDTTLQLHK